MLCAIAIAVTLAGCSAAEPPPPAAGASAPSTAAAKLPGQGPQIRGYGFKCETWDSVDAGNTQTIKVVVVPPSLGVKTKYAVDAYNNCAEISHKGALTFELDSHFLADWKPEYMVDIEFNFQADMTPSVKGPFKQMAGVPIRRGTYQDVFRSGNKFEIPADAVDEKVGIDWAGGYSIRVWDKTGSEVLAEVDPGVIVIDDDGGLGKDKP